MKKLVKSLLVVGLIGLTGCSNNQENENDIVKNTNSTYQMHAYKIEDVDGNYSYLFGNTSYVNSDVYELRKEITDAYEESTQLVMESNPYSEEYMYYHANRDEEEVRENNKNVLMNYMNLSDEKIEALETSVKNYSINNFEVIRFADTNTVYEAMEAITYGRLLNDRVNSTFYYWSEKANQDEKEIISLEEVDSKLNAIYEIEKDYSNELLELLIDSEVETSNQTIKLAYESMLNGQDDGIKTLFGYDYEQVKSRGGNYEKLVDSYENIVINQRTQNMFDQITDLVEDNQISFIAVDIIHLIDDNGLVKLLENAGYTVTKI